MLIDALGRWGRGEKGGGKGGEWRDEGGGVKRVEEVMIKGEGREVGGGMREGRWNEGGGGKGGGMREGEGREVE